MRLSRRLCVLLSLALVPVLVLVTADGASATTYTPAASGSFTTGPTSGQLSGANKLSCNLNAWWSSDSLSGPGAQNNTYSQLHVSYACSEGWNDQGLNSMTVSAPCSGTSSAASSAGSADVSALSSKVVLAPGVTWLDQASSCSITQVCFSGSVSDIAAPDWTFNACADVVLGNPPGGDQSGGTCTFGKPTQPKLIGQWQTQRLNVWFAINDVNFGASPDGTNQWRSYVVMAGGSPDIAGHTQGSGRGIGMPQPPSIVWGSYEAENSFTSQDYGPGMPQDVDGLGVGDSEVVTDQESSAAGLSYDHFKIIGWGTYRLNSGVSPSSHPAPDPGMMNEFPTTDPMSGAVGRDDPAHCSWYWGQKLVDVAGTTTDEPEAMGSTAGPITSPPDDTTTAPPSDSGCGFSWTDPTTWTSAASCAMVGLLDKLAGLLGEILDVLQNIWNAIANLASAIFGPIVDAIDNLLSGLLDALTSLGNSIVNAISHVLDSLGNLLQTLFVPSTSALKGDVSDVQDAWSGTVVGNWVGALVGVGSALSVGQPGGDCAGPSIDVSLPGAGSAGNDVTMTPFSSCGGLAVMATITKLGLTAGAYLGTILLVVRIVAASMGLNLSIGGGDDE